MTIDPNKYYIDRRLGIDVSKPKSYYRGMRWIVSGFDHEFMRECVINEHGVFVEVGSE